MTLGRIAYTLLLVIVIVPLLWWASFGVGHGHGDTGMGTITSSR
jgi:hypothetical protein